MTRADSEISTDKSSRRALICNTKASGEVLFGCGGKRGSRVICEEML